LLLAVSLLAAASSTALAQQVIATPKPDPRVGLKAGTMTRWKLDTTKFVVVQPAAEAAWNMKLLSSTPASDNFRGQTNSDLSFRGNYAIQGNYNGYQIWDISNPAKVSLATAYFCPASQSDVSVWKNLLFVSSESPAGRTDCSRDSMPTVDVHRLRGIRVFDGTDIKNPKYLANVQSCRGSHTHTVVHDPKDQDNVYIYISGTSSVRSADEVPGCLALPASDPNSACFRIEVIQVPLAKPENARIVSSARIFSDLPANGRNVARSRQDSIEQAATAAARGNGRGRGRGADSAGRGGRGADSAGRGGRGGGGGNCNSPTPTGAPPVAAAGAAAGGGRGVPMPPNQCHDITVYPAIGLAGGACAGLGLLLDIRDAAHPKRIDFVADSNFSFWHSATFNNDGSKILFTDEWGGGSAPRCRSTDKMEWGSDALFTLVNNKMTFKSYYKMPAPQTNFENCVAHNGSLIPIPAREVMVQSWYQGGVSVFDWTDISHPKEIAFFDRGPLSVDTLMPRVTGGSWSAYWYNGVIVSSEIQRGLDVFELAVSPFISQNELDAAKTVHYDQLNVQDQPKMVWPASFSLAKAYVDQLERSKGLSAARLTAARADLAAAEKAAGQARKDALTKLATALNGDAAGSSDAGKVRMLSGVVTDLAR
jgi:hypothetical protein